MHKKLLPFFIFPLLDEQPTFTESTISTSAEYASSVHAADVDGDGDL